MFIAASIIYIILAILMGPFWPFAFLAGKGGPIGYIIVIIWITIAIAGLSS